MSLQIHNKLGVTFRVEQTLPLNTTAVEQQAIADDYSFPAVCELQDVANLLALSLDAVKALIVAERLDVNMSAKLHTYSDSSSNLLHIASALRIPSLVSLLIDNGATPAVAEGYSPIGELLQEWGNTAGCGSQLLPPSPGVLDILLGVLDVHGCAYRNMGGMELTAAELLFEHQENVFESFEVLVKHGLNMNSEWKLPNLNGIGPPITALCGMRYWAQPGVPAENIPDDFRRLLELFISAGGDVNAPVSRGRYVAMHPLHVVSATEHLSAALINHAVPLLLAAGADHSPMYDGHDPLYHALRQGALVAATALIEAGACVDGPETHTTTYLTTMVSATLNEQAMLLMSFGATIKLSPLPVEPLSNLCLRAIEASGQFTALEEYPDLMDRYKVLGKNPRSVVRHLSPLPLASTAAIADALVGYGCDPNDTLSDGSNIVHRNPSLIDWAVANGVDLTARRVDGEGVIGAAIRTLGMFDASFRRVDTIIQELTAAGAPRQNSGAYYAAAFALGCLNFDTEGMDINERGYKGRTALHAAVLANARPEVIDEIIGLGGDIGARDEDGNTPLHFAGFYSGKKHGRPMKMATPRVPLEHCHPRVPIVKALLKAGADTTATNNLGLTPSDYSLYCMEKAGSSPDVHGPEYNEAAKLLADGNPSGCSVM